MHVTEVNVMVNVLWNEVVVTFMPVVTVIVMLTRSRSPAIFLPCTLRPISLRSYNTPEVLTVVCSTTHSQSVSLTVYPRQLLCTTWSLSWCTFKKKNCDFRKKNCVLRKKPLSDPLTLPDITSHLHYIENLWFTFIAVPS